MKKMQDKHVFQAAYLFFYMAFAALSVYMIPFLTSFGYSSAQRGVLFACMALFSIVMQFVVGYISDRYHQMKRVFIFLNMVEIIAIVFFYQTTKAAFWLHLLLLSVGGGLYKINYNVMDSWVLEEKQVQSDFGSIRAFGAVGFAVATMLCAKLLEMFGYTVLSYASAGFTLAGLFCTYFLKNPQSDRGFSKIRKEDFYALLHNKRYILLILIFLCINIVGTADQYTTIDKLMALSATQTQIGAKWAIQSFSELPLFFLGAMLLKRFGSYKIMVAGIVLYGIKFLGYAMAGSVGMMLWVTAMQTVTYPLITLSSRALIADLAKKSSLQTSTQLIATALYLGLSALLTPLICGWLVDFIGHSATMLSLAVFAVLPFLLALYYRKITQA